MTHLVIDSAVLDALLAAGDSQHHVLGNVPDWCRKNVPYADGHVAQKVVKQCARCKSREDWLAAKAAAEAAVKAAAS